MRIKDISVNNFKRFTNLEINSIPESSKLVVLVGPNGSGKSSFFEALNHYYKSYGYNNSGNYNYLYKHSAINEKNKTNDVLIDWYNTYRSLVSISFYDENFDNNFSDIKGHFYFRSAYRNEPDFDVQTMNRMDNPTNYVRLESLIQNDITVSQNYQRLVTNTISKVYNDSYNNINVEELRDELIGKIRQSLKNVFNDLTLTSIGDPLDNGSFYFTKGTIKNFHYRNLSAGEKSAFDLILDMVIQSQYYPDAVYCIDEPELHMHTKLQGSVLRELYSLTPNNSQIWVSTHSFGMLKEAQKLENEYPGTVVFIDFSNKNFDDYQVLKPTKINRAILNKFYELAFDDYSNLISPKKIVFCEGDSNGKSRKDFDKSIYTLIFEDTHPDTYFVSGGSCNEIETIETRFGNILNSVLSNSEIIKVVDRDERSDREVSDLLAKGIRTLSRRHIESYLLDDEIIKKLCEKENKNDLYNECIKRKNEALKNNVNQGKPVDDIKSARGEIYNSLKQVLQLSRCGNSADNFIRDTMAPLVTPDTTIYKTLEKDIFG